MSESVQEPHRGFDIVVMAASAGGIHALRTVLAGLPPDFPAPIVIVQHLSAQWPSHLAEALSRPCTLPVDWVRDGQTVQQPGVFVAPPGRHVHIGPGGTMTLSQTRRVNFVRPSADVLFGSAAMFCGARTLAVVLTGYGQDGAAGVAAVKRAGGRVIAQDARTAAAFHMPAATIRSRSVDFVLPLETIAPAMVSMVMVPGAAQLLDVGMTSAGQIPHGVLRADWEASQVRRRAGGGTRAHTEP